MSSQSTAIMDCEKHAPHVAEQWLATIENGIVVLSERVILGYGAYCDEVSMRFRWFAPLSDDLKWLSYRDYRDHPTTDGDAFDAVIAGMQRGKQEYLAYLREWSCGESEGSIAIGKPAVADSHRYPILGPILAILAGIVLPLAFMILAYVVVYSPKRF
jgi:hypothetical protein